MIIPILLQLVIAAGSEDINNITNEHLDLIQALDMPFFIVVTKVESTAPDATLLTLKTILTSVGCRKVPLLVRTDDDVLTASSRQKSEEVVPIFCVSNVTGAGLDLITRFLYVLSPGISNAERERLEQESCEFLVDEIFNITDVGPVVGGLLVKGVLTENMRMRIGPSQDGSFCPVTVQTIHRNKAPCRVVRAGQSASLSFAQDQQLNCLRSGMILLPDLCGEEPFGSTFFQVIHCIAALHPNVSQHLTLFTCYLPTGKNFGTFPRHRHLRRLPNHRSHRQYPSNSRHRGHHGLHSNRHQREGIRTISVSLPS